MCKVFVSKLPKTVDAAAVERFLVSLFPSASHVQLLAGPRAGEHKGHAFIHFAHRAAADCAVRAAASSPPVLDGVALTVRAVAAPPQRARPLPPPFAHAPHTRCRWGAAGAETRCAIAAHRTADATAFLFPSAAAAAAGGDGLTRCAAPCLTELLAERKDPRDAAGGWGEWADRFAARGLTPVTPSQALAVVAELMDGKGRVAVRDGAGNIAVLALPPHASALEGTEEGMPRHGKGGKGKDCAFS